MVCWLFYLQPTCTAMACVQRKLAWRHCNKRAQLRQGVRCRLLRTASGFQARSQFAHFTFKLYVELFLGYLLVAGQLIMLAVKDRHLFLARVVNIRLRQSYIKSCVMGLCMLYTACFYCDFIFPSSAEEYAIVADWMCIGLQHIQTVRMGSLCWVLCWVLSAILRQMLPSECSSNSLLPMLSLPFVCLFDC